MIRPEQHKIDSLGVSQMRVIFEELGWAINKFDQDYGVDFEVEIFEKHQSTDLRFKVQLKSSTVSSYSVENDFISETIETPNLIYLCQQLKEPVFLIHADIKNKKTFWLAPQLDSTLLVLTDFV